MPSRRWTDDPTLKAEHEAVVLRLSAEVHRLRAEAELSQEALARASGVDADTLLSVEQTRTDPRLSTVVRLASALGRRMEIRLVKVTAGAGS